MDVKIKYGKEVFEFNLNDELKISDSNRDNEIRNHPRSYAFLCMLSVKLKTIVKELHQESKRVYAKRMAYLREKAPSVKEAEIKIRYDKKYLKALDDVTNAEELKDIVDVSVRAFEERKDLLQTLSANTRRENK